ncbi:ribonuclease P protein component 4 [[Eubacterium] cellulosolvens]
MKSTINGSVSGTNKNRQKPHGRGRPGRRTKEMVEIAKERIRILMTLAELESVQNKNPERARRYVTLARKIGMRYNVRLEKYFGDNICRGCNSFLGTSTASRSRVRRGKVTRVCKRCGRVTRVGLQKHTKNQKVSP